MEMYCNWVNNYGKCKPTRFLVTLYITALKDAGNVLVKV